MSAFEEAWDIAKAFGDGFRVHELEPQFTGVGELPTRVIGGRLKHPIRENKPGQRSIASMKHTFDGGRGSGTGVGGAYYHGGDFDPRWESSAIPFLSRDADDFSDNIVSMNVEKPFVPLDPSGFFQFSRWLESLGDESEEKISDRLAGIRGGFEDDKFYTGPGTFDRKHQPNLAHIYGDFDPRDGKDLSDRWFDTFSALGHIPRQGYDKSYRFALRLADQLRDSDYINRIMGIREKPPFMSGFTPSVGGRRKMRTDPEYLENQRLREKYDEPWWQDSNVLSQLLEDSDYYALPKMNLLLDSMGYDSVVPFISGHRGSTRGGREIMRGSVRMPPVEDEWWMDWHPGGDDGYQKITNEDLDNLREGVARQILNFSDHNVLSQHPDMGPGGSWREFLATIPSPYGRGMNSDIFVDGSVGGSFDSDKSDLMWGHLND
tara:strand:- start:303 stop:1601 length:1299 start_codon:yes stop_codon:yes gene_type:complete